jgi:hypothetical protein
LGVIQSVEGYCERSKAYFQYWGLHPQYPSAFLSPRISSGFAFRNTRPGWSSDADYTNAAHWRIAFAAYRNVSDC